MLLAISFRNYEKYYLFQVYRSKTLWDIYNCWKFEEYENVIPMCSIFNTPCLLIKVFKSCLCVLLFNVWLVEKVMISTVRTETKTSENSFCCNDTYSFFELTFYESVIRTSTLNVTCQIIVLLAIPFFGFYYYLMLRCLFGFAVVNCTLSRSFLIFRMVLRSIKYFYFLST